ncbi:Zinc finger C2H2 [Penicillium macrosclerotiorum]|uniref:Zinc finger C2H2 n=1 Tax=Penicillium macrosclerotiorum TaxID=303699 RepID=UPI0025469444|nr:Zinc finger C2H2 [Penicillium macrosclerotiorum]KAJ5675831.1 Zinc finger C2H2 [Penicillium macrosclerotiorum]
MTGAELSMEPESMTESLVGDQYSTYNLGPYGQATVPMQAHPLPQNSLTYPPPYNASFSAYQPVAPNNSSYPSGPYSSTYSSSQM